MKPILNFLGRDAGFGKLNTSAYFIEDKCLTLIDCGATVLTELLYKEKIFEKKFDEINVIITHLHLDHVGSLSQLGLYTYFNLSKSINIITECKDIDTFLTITGLDRYANIPGFPDERYTRRNRGINFIPTVHCEMDSYGFCMDNKFGRVVYTGDTTSIEQFLPYAISGSQFYVDASINGGVHLKLADNLETLNELAENGVGVYLMHLDNEPAIREMIKGTKLQIAGD